MIKRLLTSMALSSALLFGDCMPVTGDRILARDLALADPAFSALPASTIVSYAPPPGTKRVFAVAELVRIARANRVSLARPVEICFEFPMRLMKEQDVIESMRRSLPSDAELTIVELPEIAIPDGALEFPRTGLEPAIRGAQLWHGYVRYGETLRSPVWARVTLQRHFRAVVARGTLAPNVPIDADSVRIETTNGSVEPGLLASRVEDVQGRIPKRTVRAGEAIPLDILQMPMAVRRGDAVKVEVRSGLARLQFDAIAQAPARRGDTVELRNPISGKNFRAHLDGAGKAVVTVDRKL